jgi:hypothetical protein
MPKPDLPSNPKDNRSGDEVIEDKRYRLENGFAGRIARLRERNLRTT